MGNLVIDKITGQIFLFEYTGSTVTGLDIAIFNSYTGTTAPSIYQSKTSINILTGSTLPNTYLEIIDFENYSGYSKIIAGSNITLTPSSSGITINSSGGSGSTVTANNGLRKIGDNIVFGGSLTGNTTITTATGSRLSFAGFPVQYDSDLSSSFIPRSFIDKGYVTGITTTLATVANINIYTGTTAPATYLTKVSFNSYSGNTLININSRLLISNFNSYTGTTQTTLNNKLNTSDFNIYSGTTVPIALSLKLNVNSFNIYSGLTNTNINTRLLTSAFNGYSGTTLTNINSRLLTSAFNAYSGTTLTNINTRLLTSAFNGYSGTTLTNINTRLLTSAFNTYSGTTLTNINTRLLTSAFNTYSGVTLTNINSRLLTSAFNTYSGVTLTNINTRLLRTTFNSFTGGTGYLSTGNNGLTKNGNNIRLGGVLTGATIITSPATGSRLSFASFPVQYSTDVSGDFNNRSLVDHGFVTGLTSQRLLTTNFNTYSGVTLTNINSRLLTSAFNGYSGTTLTNINTRLLTTNFNTYSGTTQPIINATVTGGTSLGGGNAVFVDKTGRNLNFKSLVAGTNITLTPTSTSITINASGVGSITGATNVGTGQVVFKQVVGANLEFKRITVSTPLSISSTANEITVGWTGSTDYVGNTKFNTYTGATLTNINNRLLTTNFNTYSGLTQTAINATVTGGTSLGGNAVFSNKTGRNLTFKGLVAGTNITLTPTATGITISATGGVGTVTNVSSANANATVATQTTTPVITIVNSPAVGGITITGTPSVGQSPVATSASAATWQTPASGFSDPMTTRGDIIFRNSSNTTARLGRGTVNQVLTSDGTDLSWATPTAASAATLTTPRTIGITTGDVTSAGSSFDGSANNTNSLTIANDAVTTAKIINGAVTVDKMATILFKTVAAGTYTILEADKGYQITFTSVCTITLPNGLTTGHWFTVWNKSGGALTFTATTTLNSIGTTITSDNVGAYFQHIGSNIWEGAGAFGGSTEIISSFPMGVSSSSVITTGVKGRYTISYNGTITGWRLISDVSSTTVIDVWKANNLIPIISNTIFGTKPSLTASELSNSGVLSIPVSDGDVFILNVDSNNSATYLRLELKIVQ